MKEDKKEEGEVVSGVARLHNFSQREQKESEGNYTRGRSRRRESCPCTRGNLAQLLPFFPRAFFLLQSHISKPADGGQAGKPGKVV